MANEQENEQSEGARSFSAFLRTVDGGSFEIELSTELHKMNGELQALASQVGKAKGELTVVFRFAHLANGQVDVNTDMKTKLPKLQRARSVFWVTKGSNLSANNPKQVEMSFRDVSAKAGPARDVEAPAAARSV